MRMISKNFLFLKKKSLIKIKSTQVLSSFFLISSLFSTQSSFAREDLFSNPIPKIHSRSYLTSADYDSFFATKNITQFGLRGTKKIVLTFDDGPAAQSTEAILDTLKKYNIRATFFMLGMRAAGHPEILRRMKEEGHILANHSYEHNNLRGSAYKDGKESSKKILSDLGKTHHYISTYADPTHKLYFRAPFGSWLSTHPDLLNNDPVLSKYVGPIFWDIGGEVTLDKNGKILAAADWSCWSSKYNFTPDKCAEGYLAETNRHQGGIILIHDITMNSAEMVEILIPKLIEDGYEFVTLDDITSLDAYTVPPLLRALNVEDLKK